MSTRPPVRLDWEPSPADRLAEVDHVDGQRRPWRAGIVALASLALGTVVVPHPIGLAAVAVVVGGAILAGVAAWRLPILRSVRQLPGRSAAVEVEAGEEGITLRREGLERTLAPTAIRDLVVGSDHVFLHLVTGEVLTVPCRLFAERGGLDRFVLAVERFRKRGQAPPEVHEPGFDRWRLEYRIDAGHLAPASVRSGDLERLGLVAVAVVSIGLVVAVADPWSDGLDLVLVALVGVVAVVLVAGMSRQAWVAVGLVRAAFGSAGGRIRGVAGVLRFGWDEVTEVTESPTGVVLRLTDRVLWIPGRAFRSSEDQSRFVGQVEDWWLLAHPQPTPPPAEPAPAATGTEDPYAPPRS